ncbi:MULTISPECIES: universal stress protein [Emticicia]|uniref:universal stress protein n=1 Tax=Emticicia TaxID=312278 RepID=UPI0007D8A8B1|nr:MULTISPECIES: universal stress protein [Emticicia]
MFREIENILFPTDFSENASNALRVAVSVAKLHNSHLHLLHVTIPQYVSMIGEIPFGTTYDAWTDLEKINKQNLEDLAKSLRKKHRISITIHTKIGYVADTIEKTTHQQDIDLIIMGTHGSSLFKDLLIGSNTYQTIKNAVCPVLTIPAEFKTNEFFNVLFPVRNVAGVDEKYHAISHLLRSKRSKIELLGVINFYDIESFDAVSAKANELIIQMEGRGIETSYRNVYCNHIADFILEYAHFNQSDLLVINVNIDSDWKQHFLGTYAQKIVKNAKCPVLSIKPQTVSNATDSQEVEQVNPIYPYEFILPPIVNI